MPDQNLHQKHPSSSVSHVPNGTQVDVATITSVFDARLSAEDVGNFPKGVLGVSSTTEMRAALWDTHAIANYTALALSVVLNAGMRNEIGASIEERRILGAYLRVMMRVGDNLYGELTGKRAASSVDVNYLDFLNKPTYGAAPSTSRAKLMANGTVQPPMPTDGMKTVRDKIESVRKSIQRLMPKLSEHHAKLKEQWVTLDGDAELALSALPRIAMGWRPLAPHLTPIWCGVTTSCRSMKDIYTLQENAGEVSSAWRATIASTCVQRLKSHYALGRGWERDAAELRQIEPRYPEMSRMLRELQFPEKGSSFHTLVKWCLEKGPAAMSAFNSKAAPDFTIPPGHKRPLAFLFAQNPELKDTFERLSAFRDLQSRNPTYTQIDPIKHPLYFVLTAPNSSGLYRELSIAPDSNHGTIKITALRNQGGIVVEEPLVLPLRVDTRFKRVTASSPEEKLSSAKANLTGTYYDAGTGQFRQGFVLKGARLAPQLPDPKAVHNAHFTLSFVAQYDAPDASQTLHQIRDHGGKVLSVSYGFTAGVWEDGAVLATLADDKVSYSKAISIEPTTQPNARHDVGDIKAGEKIRTQLTLADGIFAAAQAYDLCKSSTGRLVRDESAGTHARDHVAASMNQYRKELAHTMVREALALECPAILVPFYKGVRPSVHYTPAQNRLIATKGRGELERILEQTARRASIAVLKGTPYGLNSVCAECGELGVVVKLPTDLSKIRFACSCCNCVTPVADNGARNLAKQIPLILEEVPYGEEFHQRSAPALYEFHQRFPSDKRSEQWRLIEKAVLRRLGAD